MEGKSLIKIAIVGPESTGKSELSLALAKHFRTVAIPEYARSYCANLNRTCTIEDELNMFHGQLALEEKYLPLVKNNLLFCDTTVLTVKIWTDYTFGSTPEVVTNEIQTRIYDFYLLLNIDLPWEEDPLRDFPHLRAHFLAVWKTELTAIHAKYQLISGMGKDREQAAIYAVNRYLSTRT